MRICVRCKVLVNKPPVRADLMQLKVKDLQRYLVSKDVNTKACVGKIISQSVRPLMYSVAYSLPTTSLYDKSYVPRTCILMEFAPGKFLRVILRTC